MVNSSYLPPKYDMSYTQKSSRKYTYVSVFLWIVGANFSVCKAKDLGVQGQLFNITEESLLDVINKKLQALSTSGKLKILQENIARRAQSKIERPTPVKGVTKTSEHRHFTYDPV